MTIQRLEDLTAITQKCFQDDKQPLTNITSAVAELWCLLDDKLQQKLHLSAKCVSARKIELSVGRTDLHDRPLGTLIEKQYDVEEETTSLRVTPMFVEWNDNVNDNNQPRSVFSYNFHDEFMSTGHLIAKLIDDVADYMTQEERVHLMHGPSLQNNSTPIAKAFKLALYMLRTKEPIACDDDGPSSELF